jgi:hypothetical protein
MPIDPSALPWWGWLLCGVVCIVIALVATLYGSAADDSGNRWDGVFWRVVGALAGFGGIIALAIGLIRFVKWAWG